MPWLLPEPALALAEWRGRLHALTTHLKRQAAQYRAALRPDVTRAATRNRLKLLAMACSDHARRLQALLAPLETEAEPAAAATYAALAPVVATAQGLASYYANVHRDWNWGDDENRASCEAVRRALGSARVEQAAGARQRGGAAAVRSARDPASRADRRGRHQSAADGRCPPYVRGGARRPLRVSRGAARPGEPRPVAHADRARARRARAAARVRRREAATVRAGQLRYGRHARGWSTSSTPISTASRQP